MAINLLPHRIALGWWWGKIDVFGSKSPKILASPRKSVHNDLNQVIGVHNCKVVPPDPLLVRRHMNRSRTGKWLLLSIALIALLIVPCALAQETTAGLQGTVKDPSGSVMANATVEVAGPALIGTRKAQTDVGGNFRFGALPPGQYSLTALSNRAASTWRLAGYPILRFRLRWAR